jgi:hypothetical protein
MISARPTTGCRSGAVQMMAPSRLRRPSSRLSPVAIASTSLMWSGSSRPSSTSRQSCANRRRDARRRREFATPTWTRVASIWCVTVALRSPSQTRFAPIVVDGIRRHKSVSCSSRRQRPTLWTLIRSSRASAKQSRRRGVGRASASRRGMTPVNSLDDAAARQLGRRRLSPPQYALVLTERERLSRLNAALRGRASGVGDDEGTGAGGSIPRPTPTPRPIPIPGPTRTPTPGADSGGGFDSLESRVGA